MLRSALTLLLLLHYLLVVCAGATGRAEAPKARAFSYVHSHDCQVKNAWRGGVCYDDCNGTQYECHKGHPPQSLPQLLAAFKGLDVHCLAALALPAPASVAPWCAERRAPGQAYRVPTGVRGEIDSPPRRG
ncbi:MAG: hypothetical protein EOO59_15760 [Hymenobacter sp.]|nr:MAG: hypothetical protein EOO59_15760 [Hymenobacter sp.]